MPERTIITQLNDHIWLLDDAHEATGYLVTGHDRAAMIDTMNGQENLREVVSSITDLPVVVINTHGHCDHIAGNVFFDAAYMNPVDRPVVEEFLNEPEVAAYLKEHHMVMPPFLPLNDGDTIDLGGLTLEAISLPGHTPGSLCLLLREDRILFTGDSINHHLWMQLDHSLPLKDALSALDHIEWVRGKADRILHGHARGFDDISLFDQLRQGFHDLIEQKELAVTNADAPYKWFGGEDKMHVFAPDSVICYRLDKLPDEAR